MSSKSPEIKEFDLDEQIEQAVRYFESGYNCAQSVFLAYANIVNIDRATAEKMSVSFGGGIGRMREVCGAVTAMAMLTGFKYPVNDINDLDARSCNYAMVQKETGLFKDKFHFIYCRDLLNPSEANTNPTPSARTAKYYKERPCAKYVAEAAHIAGCMLKGKLDQLS